MYLQSTGFGAIVMGSMSVIDSNLNSYGLNPGPWKLKTHPSHSEAVTSGS